MVAPVEIEVIVAGTLYLVVLTPEIEVTGYSATVPALPGCFTCGDMVEEARSEAIEAISCYLELSA